MKLTPMDIKKQKFKKVLRGLDPVEVETFLGMIASELEETLKVNKELKDKVIELETQLRDYKAMEKTLQQTLAHAQETSVRAIENSRKESQLIITEAEMKAAQIVDKARADLTRMKEEISILRAKKDTIINRLRMLLNSEMDLIKALEVDEEFQRPTNDDQPKEPTKEQIEIDEILRNLDK